MTTSLLTTKLYIPPARPELVPRPRLIERLNAGLHRKLTLISAPAGFGKTTLLSEWGAGYGRPVISADPPLSSAWLRNWRQLAELGEADLFSHWRQSSAPLGTTWHRPPSRNRERSRGSGMSSG